MNKPVIALSALVVFLTGGLFIGTAAAEDDASHKFTRGALNTTTGWTELPRQVVTQTSEDPYQGMTYGLMDGLTLGTKRTLFGAWDWVTSPFPPYDTPKMQPETPFGDAP